jgi:hypothetical protein
LAAAADDDDDDNDETSGLLPQSPPQQKPPNKSKMSLFTRIGLGPGQSQQRQQQQQQQRQVREERQKKEGRHPTRHIRVPQHSELAQIQKKKCPMPTPPPLDPPPRKRFVVTKDKENVDPLAPLDSSLISQAGYVYRRDGEGLTDRNKYPMVDRSNMFF